MSSSWLNNNKVQVSLVSVDSTEYLVYRKTTAGIPNLIEEVATGKRITYADVQNAVLSSNNNLNIDEIVKLMINKLKSSQ